MTCGNKTWGGKVIKGGFKRKPQKNQDQKLIPIRFQNLGQQNKVGKMVYSVCGRRPGEVGNYITVKAN